MANIYQTFSLADARYKVCITQNPLEADLFVYLVNQRGLACGAGLWYKTDIRAASTTKVYFGARSIADVIIYFVNNQAKAGWKRPHRLQNTL